MSGWSLMAVSLGGLPGAMPRNSQTLPHCAIQSRNGRLPIPAGGGASIASAEAVRRGGERHACLRAESTSGDITGRGGCTNIGSALGPAAELFRVLERSLQNWEPGGSTMPRLKLPTQTHSLNEGQASSAFKILQPSLTSIPISVMHLRGIIFSRIFITEGPPHRAPQSGPSCVNGLACCCG